MIPGSKIQAQVVYPLSEPEVVRIEFETLEQARELAAILDVWEVHPEEGYLIALVRPDQVLALAAAGEQIHIESQLSSHPETIPDYPCFRTVTELYAHLEQVVDDHVGIADLSIIGFSHGGQAIKVLRITNKQIPGDKPVLFVMANIHGREMITPEVASSFIDYLTDNYGQDADITWVIDHHEIHIVVTSNPDGHVKNEPGQPWAWWRKNTNPSNGCETGNYGVDLNRNHSFQWGCCGGSSTNTCDDTYRGPSAGSEMETQVVQNYVRLIFPDQRGPNLDDAAPDDATGILISLHSYGNLVLWPWGFTDSPVPNHTGMEALGQKLAFYNGYTPSQSYDLYPTDGTTDEWAYGDLGIAAFTFEIGSSSDGFYPSCNRYDALVNRNIPALFFAAKTVRTPYQTAQGPDVINLSVSPALVPEKGIYQLSAAIADDFINSNQIVAAEYYIDIPPWAGGIGIGMQALDGQFDSVNEEVIAEISAQYSSEETPLIYVRGQNENGFWGPISAVFLTNEQSLHTYFPLIEH